MNRRIVPAYTVQEQYIWRCDQCRYAVWPWGGIRCTKGIIIPADRRIPNNCPLDKAPNEETPA